MPRKVIGFAIKLAVTGALFTLLFRPETFGLREDLFGNVSPRTMLAELRAAHPQHLVLWLTFATVVKLAGMFAGIVRWRLLLGGQGLRIPFVRLVQSWFIGRFYGIFLPSTIGLDGYRFYDSFRYTGEGIKSGTVIAVEKLIGFVALTFLVFLTFPLGFRLLKINVTILAVILMILAGFVLVSFLLLLNPRVIQILVAVIPTPAILRNKLDKLGAAVTAYSGNRVLLLQATLCGLLVHLGTCFMFFGTMMAVRAEGTTLMDILFASPIMIYGTVLGPSIGGEGIREIVFVTLLKGTTPEASAALFSHLGWWVGEVIPFLIGAVFLVMSRRPTREELTHGLASARDQATAAPPHIALHLSPHETRLYRSSLLWALLAGAGGGLLAGACVGLFEAVWVVWGVGLASDGQALWWGPSAYSLLFSGLGIACAAVLCFLYLLRGHFPRPARTLGFSMALCLAAGVCVIGMFRIKRDVLDMHSLSLWQVGAIVLAALLLAGLSERLASWLAPRKKAAAGKGFFIVALAFVAILALGGVGSLVPKAEPAMTPLSASPATGPNIILVVTDTLRADYLPLYADDLPITTPGLEAFAKDAVLFRHGFSQAAWTKPSFATIFSGLYPATHTATSKDRALPPSVVTFPEVLHEGGYYTQGFANNTNIVKAFNFHQGFVDYVDLEPSLYFGANRSSAGLSLYGAMRKIRLTVLAKMGRLPGLGSLAKADVRDFFQPADAVNVEVLRWLDSEHRPKDRPFFLFVHYMDPHDPYIDEETGNTYARATMEHPDPRLREAMVDAYFDGIKRMDRAFGALMEELRKRHLYDDSVVVFTADHGEEFYDHKGWWHGQTLYDEQIHVPYLVKLPGNASAGRTSEALVRHVDLGPSLLALAGLEVPAAMQGKPLFESGGAMIEPDTWFVFSQEDFEGNVLESVRTLDGKLIRANPDNPRGLAPLEYYDIARDPREQVNVSGQGIPQESDLLQAMEGMEPVLKENAAEPEQGGALTQEQRDNLNAIGYLQN